MLMLKPGVDLRKLQPQMVLGLLIIFSIWDHYGVQSLVVTSCCDGDHKDGSLHYVGRAVDLRIRDITHDHAMVLVSRFRSALGADFDVILEVDHIHVEYDPK